MRLSELVGGRAAVPRPRRRGGDQGFRLPDPSYLDIKHTGWRSGMIKLPKICWIRFRGWRPLPGETITGQTDGWNAAVQCERDIAVPQAGIGRRDAAANAGRKTLKALRRAQ